MPLVKRTTSNGFAPKLYCRRFRERKVESGMMKREGLNQALVRERSYRLHNLRFTELLEFRRELPNRFFRSNRVVLAGLVLNTSNLFPNFAQLLVA